MPNATRLTVSIIGVYAGLLGAAHGYFETLQASAVPAGGLINAMGAPCQPETIAHACFPALTVLPNVQVSGLLALAVSLLAAIWAVGFVERKRGGLVLFLLAVLMLLVGAGFLPPFYAMLAAGAATQINAPRAWWRARLSPRRQSALAGLMPGLLIIYLVWICVKIIFADALNAVLLAIGGLLIPVELGVLVLTVLAAFAYDIRRQ